MALVNCKECKKSVSNKAKTCPHCGAAVEVPMSGTAKAAIILFGLSVFAVASMFMDESSERAERPAAPEHTQSQAWVMCQVFAERQLRAPRTARWPSRPEAGRRSGEARYVLQGYVDAQNAFGAMIRNRVHCEVEYTGDDDWRLIEMRIE